MSISYLLFENETDETDETRNNIRDKQNTNLETDWEMSSLWLIIVVSVVTRPDIPVTCRHLGHTHPSHSREKFGNDGLRESLS